MRGRMSGRRAEQASTLRVLVNGLLTTPTANKTRVSTTAKSTPLAYPTHLTTHPPTHPPHPPHPPPTHLLPAKLSLHGGHVHDAPHVLRPQRRGQLPQQRRRAVRGPAGASGSGPAPLLGEDGLGQRLQGGAPQASGVARIYSGALWWWGREGGEGKERGKRNSLIKGSHLAPSTRIIR